MKKKFNKYCLVLHIKPEHKDDYIEIHQNAWPEPSKEGQAAGAEELFIYFYNNMSIVNFVCEDIDKFYQEYGKYDCVKKWNDIVTPWIETAPSLTSFAYTVNNASSAIRTYSFV